MSGLILTVLAWFGPYTLLLLMGVAFAETGFIAGFLLPGDTLMVTAGVLVAAGALHLPLPLTLPAVILAAAAGDQVAFHVGRRVGAGRQPGRVPRLFTADRRERAAVFFDRYGATAVVLSRFLPLARVLTPVLAGASGMRWRRFAVYDLAGAAVWGASTLGSGYVLGRMWGVAGHLDLIVAGAVAVAVVHALVAVLRRRARTGSRAERGGCRLAPASCALQGAAAPALERTR